MLTLRGRRLSQTAAASLFTAAITLMGTSCQQAHQDERADKAKFLDGAQATAQETSRLLYDGYNALDKLLREMNKKGWKEFSKGPWDDYRQFHRGWRQQLIAEHFKLSRYFGKDKANELIHIDEIDIRPVDNFSSPDVCSPPGEGKDFDMAKLSAQIECYARFVTFKQDMINEDIKDRKAGELFDALESKSRTEESAKELLQHYDKSTVSYLRRLDAALTNLGAAKVPAIPNGS
ncbi:hypothetical protein [Pseudomonas sp. R151218B TE3479]